MSAVSVMRFLTKLIAVIYEFAMLEFSPKLARRQLHLPTTNSLETASR